MAMKFGGFTPEQMGKIIPEMAGMQADEQAKFLAATPSAASRVGMMAEQASKRISMAQGGYVQGYQIGGLANQAVQGLAGVMPELAQGNVQPFNNIMTRPSLQPDPRTIAEFKPGKPVEPRPDIDQAFYNSPEYADFKKNNTMGSQDMYDSPYFGSMGSGSMGRAQDKAYETYLSNRANQGGTAIPEGMLKQMPQEYNYTYEEAQKIQNRRSRDVLNEAQQKAVNEAIARGPVQVNR